MDEVWTHEIQPNFYFKIWTMFLFIFIKKKKEVGP